MGNTPPTTSHICSWGPGVPHTKECSTLWEPFTSRACSLGALTSLLLGVGAAALHASSRLGGLVVCGVSTSWSSFPLRVRLRRPVAPLAIAVPLSVGRPLVGTRPLDARPRVLGHGALPITTLRSLPISLQGSAGISLLEILLPELAMTPVVVVRTRILGAPPTLPRNERRLDASLLGYRWGHHSCLFGWHLPGLALILVPWRPF